MNKVKDINIFIERTNSNKLYKLLDQFKLHIHLSNIFRSNLLLLMGVCYFFKYKELIYSREFIVNIIRDFCFSF